MLFIFYFYYFFLIIINKGTDAPSSPALGCKPVQNPSSTTVLHFEIFEYHEGIVELFQTSHSEELWIFEGTAFTAVTFCGYNDCLAVEES